MNDDAGDALVDVAGTRRYGRLSARPRVVNPLDEYRGPTRCLKWLRLKEWVGFTLIHPELASSMIVQDAHYLASSELYVAELNGGQLAQHARNARGGSIGLPAVLFGSHCALRKPGYALEYEFGARHGAHRISIDVAQTESAAAIAGELELDGARTPAPLSVSSRLPGGSMYTHKVIYPASGTLRVGNAEYVFEKTRDLAILDEHHSFFPYRTTWTWGTFAQMSADGPMGANFSCRPELPGEQEESCVWLPTTAEPLSDVTFNNDSDVSGPWRIASDDGRLDVRFTPDGHKEVKHQLGVAEIEYVQLYGTYSGALSGASRPYDLKGVRGVCERMRTRF